MPQEGQESVTISTYVWEKAKRYFPAQLGCSLKYIVANRISGSLHIFLLICSKVFIPQTQYVSGIGFDKTRKFHEDMVTP